MRVSEAFRWHMPGFVIFVESTLIVWVGRAVVGHMSWPVLVVCSIVVLGIVDLPMTRCLIVEANGVTCCTVGSIVSLLGAVLEDGPARVRVWLNCSYRCWSGCGYADRWLSLHGSM